MMDVPETIRKIKTELRLAMNGAVAAYMRENGISYKLNFGVELPRLRDIAARFPTDHGLAQALWKEDIRECKLLAAMLQPADTFCPEVADAWVKTMPGAEIARHTVQNLFCRLPYASRKAYEWIASDDEMCQQCGYLTLARLFMQGLRPDERPAGEFLGQVRAALHASPPVRRAAVAALQKYQTLDEAAREEGERILREAGA